MKIKDNCFLKETAKLTIETLPVFLCSWVKGDLIKMQVKCEEDFLRCYVDNNIKRVLFLFSHKLRGANKRP